MGAFTLTTLLALLMVASGPAAQTTAPATEPVAFDEEAPAAGYWVGQFLEPAGEGVLGTFLVERAADDAWSAKVTALVAGLLDAEATDVEIDGSSVSLTLPAHGGAHVMGRVSDDGQRLAGTVHFDERDGAPIEFELTRSLRPLDLPEPMAFAGKLKTPQMALDMVVVVAETPGGNWVGHIDIPAQSLFAYPLVDVGRDGDTFTATVPVPNAPATITADLSDDGRTLAGHFKQSVFNLPIELERDADYAGATLDRPQHPSPPFPYETREVTIEHPEGHVLAGTLTLPDGAGPHPAVVMITGSGPQDRDEMIFQHRPFLVIADHLTRRGIAVLRCDDRGTAESTGSFSGATSEDFASDALAQVRYLGTVSEVDAERIGLIGHSEGALIAPIVANESDDVAFAVLLAGPGVPGHELLALQAGKILEAGGADPMTIAQSGMQQQMLFKLVRDGKSTEEMRETLEPLIQAQLAASGLDADDAEDAIDAQLEMLAGEWMRFFLTYDPRPALEAMTVPVLAMNGTLDLQVWHEQNLDEIERVMKEAGRDVTIKRYEGLNHLFQPAETGAIGEYATIETTFDERVLQDMTEWITKKMNVGGESSDDE